jgi:hypothetical protein
MTFIRYASIPALALAASLGIATAAPAGNAQHPAQAAPQSSVAARYAYGYGYAPYGRGYGPPGGPGYYYGPTYRYGPNYRGPSHSSTIYGAPCPRDSARGRVCI